MNTSFLEQTGHTDSRKNESLRNRFLGDRQMETADFVRAPIDAMINLSDPLAVLATRLPRDQTDLHPPRLAALLAAPRSTNRIACRGGATRNPG